MEEEGGEWLQAGQTGRGTYPSYQHNIQRLPAAERFPKLQLDWGITGVSGYNLIILYINKVYKI